MTIAQNIEMLELHQPEYALKLAKCESISEIHNSDGTVESYEFTDGSVYTPVTA